MEENLNVGTEIIEEDTAPANAEDIANSLIEGTEDVGGESPAPESKEETPDNSDYKAEDIDFEEDLNGAEVFEGYDLKKFSEVLNLENEENRAIITSEMRKLKAAGFNQAQAELFVAEQIRIMEEYEADITPVPTTRAEVMEVLKNSLTREEKANYKPILGWLKEDGKNIGLSDTQINEAMSNPVLVKLMNSFYKRASSKGSVKTNEIKAPESTVTIGFESAMSKVQEEIMKGTPKDKVIEFGKKLEASLKGADLAQFKTTFGRIFGIK